MDLHLFFVRFRRIFVCLTVTEGSTTEDACCGVYMVSSDKYLPSML